MAIMDNSLWVHVSVSELTMVYKQVYLAGPEVYIPVHTLRTGGEMAWHSV